MSELAQRYGHASPRTKERPMVFTAGEFWRGAGLAWLAFTIASPLTLAVWMLALAGRQGDGSGVGFALALAFASPFYVVPWSLVALGLGSPLAYLLGRSLSRVARTWVHLTSFAVLGVLVTAITFVAYLGFVSLTSYWFDWSLLLLPEQLGLLFVTMPSLPVTAAGALMLGWWLTSRKALRKDALVEKAAELRLDARH